MKLNPHGKQPVLVRAFRGEVQVVTMSVWSPLRGIFNRP